MCNATDPTTPECSKTDGDTIVERIGAVAAATKYLEEEEVTADDVKVVVTSSVAKG